MCALGEAAQQFILFFLINAYMWQVPMEEEALAEGAPETAAALRALGEADRDILERATRAFVSYVRGYKEHQVCAATCSGSGE